MTVVFRSYRKDVLDQLMMEILSLFVTFETTFNIRGPVPLPVKRKKFTVNRSPHIYKKSREQFEIATYSRLLVFSESLQVLESGKISFQEFISLVESIVPGGVMCFIRMKI